MASQYYKGKQVTLDFGPLGAASFANILDAYVGQKILILVDENTQQHCLDYLLTRFEQLAQAEVLVIPPGEESKSIELVVQLWDLLLAYEVTKKDLLICLGGGVVTDIGGFIASTYKRGLEVIMIPTTLLSMVDAAIGGKNGIDFQGVKNMIGCTKQALYIFIDPAFLSTLPIHELRSGWAECIKHALIAGPHIWNDIKESSFLLHWDDFQINPHLLWELILIKINIVEKDPLEKGERKVLNLGHTIGHALESFQNELGEPISHGHAIAWGLILESHISMQQGYLNNKEFQELNKVIETCFAPLHWHLLNASQLFKYLNQDKKNQDHSWRYVALKAPGVYQIDKIIKEQELALALDWLKQK